MSYPNFLEERKLWKKGYKYVVGLDEAGRGPLAGPVVAGAVMVKNQKPKTKNQKHKLKTKKLNNLTIKQFNNLGIKDSKKLSPKKREEFYKILTKHPNIGWGLGRVSERVIDKINILEATKLAMIKAIKNLEKKLVHVFYGRRKGVTINFLIIDGNFKIDLPILQKPVVKGDEKVFSCAAASIIAKVSRDRLMERYDKKYPGYGFSKHKGYPTKFHLKMLKKYRPSVIHRLTFKPVKKMIL